MRKTLHIPRELRAQVYVSRGKFFGSSCAHRDAGRDSARREIRIALQVGSATSLPLKSSRLALELRTGIRARRPVARVVRTLTHNRLKPQCRQIGTGYTGHKARSTHIESNGLPRWKMRNKLIPQSVRFDGGPFATARSSTNELPRLPRVPHPYSLPGTPILLLLRTSLPGLDLAFCKAKSSGVVFPSSPNAREGYSRRNQ